MSPFYTRTGDDGTTSLIGKDRVPKYDPRPEAYGEIDEASAALGLARALATADQTKEILIQIQRDLYAIMAEIAATKENAPRFRVLSEQHVAWIEKQLDILSNQVEIPNEFILPGDSLASAALSLARTITRRAERRVAKLYHLGEIDNQAILSYLNRLSSLLFIMELFEIQSTGFANPSLAKGLPDR